MHARTRPSKVLTLAAVHSVLSLSWLHLRSILALFRLNPLQENQSIQFLDLSANKIGDEVAISLAEILPAHPQLDTLDISANRIGDLGLAALAASLIQPPHLRALRAWGNDFAKNAAEAFTVLAAEAPALQLDVQPYEVDGVFQVAQV